MPALNSYKRPPEQELEKLKGSLVKPSQSTTTPGKVVKKQRLGTDEEDKDKADEMPSAVEPKKLFQV